MSKKLEELVAELSPIEKALIRQLAEKSPEERKEAVANLRPLAEDDESGLAGSLVILAEVGWLDEVAAALPES